MNTPNLIRWIDAHQPPSPTQDNGDGTLTVFSAYVMPDRSLVVEPEVIPATMSAARAILGY